MNYQIFILKNGQEINPFFTCQNLSKEEFSILSAFTIRYETKVFKDNFECARYAEIWAQSIKNNTDHLNNKK